MKISKLSRFVLAVVSTIMLMFSFSTVPMAMAADATPAVSFTAERLSETGDGDEGVMSFDGYIPVEGEPEIRLLDDGGAADGSASGSSGADTSYSKVINFFITWIRRIGAFVALVGAVMFGLAIKNNDAEQKQNGLLTMIAGFVVVAITAAVDMFDLFT